MGEVLDAIKYWLISKFDKVPITMSQVEMIRYLQTELEKAHRENGKLIEVITSLATSKSPTEIEHEPKMEDLEPITNHRKPWSVIRQEKEKASFDEWKRRQDLATENLRKNDPVRAADIDNLEKELGVI